MLSWNKNTARWFRDEVRVAKYSLSFINVVYESNGCLWKIITTNINANIYEASYIIRCVNIRCLHEFIQDFTCCKWWYNACCRLMETMVLVNIFIHLYVCLMYMQVSLALFTASSIPTMNSWLVKSYTKHNIFWKEHSTSTYIDSVTVQATEAYIVKCVFLLVYLPVDMSTILCWCDWITNCYPIWIPLLKNTNIHYWNLKFHWNEYGFALNIVTCKHLSLRECELSTKCFFNS